MWNLRTRLLPLLLVIILVWVFFYYSFNLVERLREARSEANETVAWFWAGSQVPLSSLAGLGSAYVCSRCGTTFPSTGFVHDPTDSGYCPQCGKVTRWFYVTLDRYEDRKQLLDAIRSLFRNLVERLDYTTVLTDTEMLPQVFNGSAVTSSVSPESLLVLRAITRDLDQENDPIPITATSGDTIGYLHYGSDDLERELLLVPYIEMGLIFILVLLFLFIIRNEMKKEKELSWASFAKETAHQLSTPLSSLMGWLEILHDRPEADEDRELSEALDCMEDDLARLRQIASRYGQMGKKPKMERTMVNPVLLDTVHYFTGRPGLLSKGIELETDFRSRFQVELNPILFGWVLENLLKNSIAAIRKESRGTIRISSEDVAEGDGKVEIEISDSGSGIPFKHQKRIFSPGFTTRRGGWGLGLTLSRRIIERYHKGSLRLKASSPGKGTSFLITIPAARRSEE